MNSKKFRLPLVLAASLVAGLVSCGNNPAPSSSQPGGSSSGPASSSGSTTSTPTSSVVSSEEPLPVINCAEVDTDGPHYEDIEGKPGGSSGVVSLTNMTTEEKNGVMGALEKYVVDHKVTGLPLFENGGYVMYQDRVVKGTNNYIPGYGFGILREGYLNGPLTGEGVVNPTYYHSYEDTDPATINYLDSDNSLVSDLYGYISSAYFGNKMNATKDAYEWYGVLSKKDRPVKLKKDAQTGELVIDTKEEGNSPYWRIYVRTGQDGGVKYQTSSSLRKTTWDGRGVEAEDYITAFKVLLCGAHGYYRGAELASNDGIYGIEGVANYLNASGKGMESPEAEAAWEKVGIKLGEDADGAYIDFTLMSAASRFYAMYSLSSSLYQPIPLDFFKEVTDNLECPGNYGSYNEDMSTTPVDNILSLSPYVLDTWETDKAITFKRNANWFECVADQNVYRIPGVHLDIFPAILSDSDAAVKEFIANRFDAAGLTLNTIAEYKEDKRTTKVPGDTVWKLNINSCTQEQWNKLFGENGTISQGGERVCKPWMANDNFIRGVFYSINRDDFAADRGYIPSINYFADAYMSDPENGVSYNSTKEHAAALTDFWGETVDTYGFDLNLSQACFNEAIGELMTAGDVKAGDTLKIDIWWMRQANVTTMGNAICKFIQDSFNTCTAATENNLTLDIAQNVPESPLDVYYEHLMVGEFDFGFGSISGNTLDPLNFFEVLKSDNSSGFTLNWGPDTSKLDLVYNEQTWSFDSLWAAADHGCITYKGAVLPGAVMYAGATPAVHNPEDDSITFGLTVEDVKANAAERAKKGDKDAEKIAEAETLSVTIEDFYVYDAYSGGAFYAYFDTEGKQTNITEGFDEKDCTLTVTGNNLEFTFSQEVLSCIACFWTPDGSSGYVGFGFDATVEIAGSKSAINQEVYFVIGTAAE